jgi:hypothetical protein
LEGSLQKYGALIKRESFLIKKSLVFLPFVSRLLTHLHIQKTKKTNEQTLLLYDPSIMKWV